MPCSGVTYSVVGYERANTRTIHSNRELSWHHSKAEKVAKENNFPEDGQVVLKPVTGLALKASKDWDFPPE